MRGYTSLEIGTMAHGTSNGSNADENGSHSSVTESRDSVPVTKTVLHPESLFSYWQQLCSIAIALRGGSPFNSPPSTPPPIPRKPQPQGYRRKPGSAPRKPAPPRLALLRRGAGSAAEASQPRIAVYGPLPGSRPGVSGSPKPSATGFSEPRPRRTGAKGALGSRPAASEDVGRTVVGLGIAGVGLGTLKGRMSAGRQI